MNVFLNFYNEIVTEFEKSDSLQIVTAVENQFRLPKSSGVYVIWRHNSSKIDNLIYVGLAGKIKRTKSGEVIMNSGSLNLRKSRWTPYRFCESKKDLDRRFTFRYGPKLSNVNKQAKIKYDADAYSHTVPYEDMIIHCFSIAFDHPVYTPALLESLLLTKYLKCRNDLPPGNNSI